MPKFLFYVLVQYLSISILFNLAVSIASFGVFVLLVVMNELSGKLIELIVYK